MGRRKEAGMLLGLRFPIILISANTESNWTVRRAAAWLRTVKGERRWAWGESRFWRRYGVMPSIGTIGKLCYVLSVEKPGRPCGNLHR
ncbi:hypothetical protein DQX05_16945 [Paenibacillus thiaminolyticus]|uniref:Uncharacterized protein n=1 Tax=Paenibacillus thiaminolyticus TaxID=49283 RepID=A0A3A3GH83_PANTH|nr:hypothetical protein DQX05_16945 [Paenibacillus thiaminolyticus]